MTAPAHQDAVETVQSFLDEYTLRDEYHRKGAVRRLVYVQYVEAEGGGVHVEFAVDSEDFDSGDDADVQALAAKAVEALRQSDAAMASLPIRVTFE
jgi:hypothetical protein